MGSHEAGIYAHPFVLGHAEPVVGRGFGSGRSWWLVLVAEPFHAR